VQYFCDKEKGQGYCPFAMQCQEGFRMVRTIAMTEVNAAADEAARTRAPRAGKGKTKTA
jgi:hypothetical protein